MCLQRGNIIRKERFLVTYQAKIIIMASGKRKWKLMITWLVDPCLSSPGKLNSKISLCVPKSNSALLKIWCSDINTIKCDKKKYIYTKYTHWDHAINMLVRNLCSAALPADESSCPIITELKDLEIGCWSSWHFWWLKQTKIVPWRPDYSIWWDRPLSLTFDFQMSKAAGRN